MRKLTSQLVVAVALLPNVVLASWWNPFSWTIWDAWFRSNKAEVVDVSLDLQTNTNDEERERPTAKLDLSAFENTEVSVTSGSYTAGHASDSSNAQDTDANKVPQAGSASSGMVTDSSPKSAPNHSPVAAVQTESKAPPQSENLYAYLTNEQRAIKMATDVGYPDSPLHDSVRREIDTNWKEIMTYYKGARGKGSVDAMFQDILEAYIVWKTQVQQTRDTGSKSALSTFSDCMDEVTQKVEKRRKERQQCLDDHSDDPISAYTSCPVVNTSSLYAACGVEPTTSTSGLAPSGSKTADQNLGSATRLNPAGDHLMIYRQASLYTRIGNTWYGDNGSSFTKIGDTIYANDGTNYSQIGSTVYGSDGSSYLKIGSTTYRNDGNSYTRIGNTVYGTDGTQATQIGNTTYVNQ